MSDTSEVLARRDGSAVQFRASGRVTADNSPAMKRYAEAAMAAGATSITVDLSRCTNFDSTFLGTLMVMRRRLAPEDGAFVLAAVSPACLRIIGNTGCTRLFPLSDAPITGDTGWTTLEGEMATNGPRSFQENIVAAHQALVEVGGALGERYRAVVEHIERELKASAPADQTSAR
jgi:anti-anti-sigma factor